MPAPARVSDETARLRICVPGDARGGGGASGRGRRRRQGARGRPEPGADDGVPRRIAGPVGRFAQARRPAADRDHRRRGAARRHGALARHRGRCTARYRASLAQGRDRRGRPLPDPQSRHRRRQHRPCRSGRRDAGHRGDLRRRDRGGRPRRTAGHQRRRFFHRAAHHRARRRRDHRRDPASGLAGGAALGLQGILPPARRFRHGRHRAVLRRGRRRQGAQCPCRRHRGRRPAAAAGGGGSGDQRRCGRHRGQRARRCRRVRRGRPRRAIFTRAPPTARRCSERWSSVRCKARAPDAFTSIGHHAGQLRGQRQAASASRSSRA